MRILFVIFLPVLIFQSNLFIIDQYIIDQVNISYGEYLEDAYMIISHIETEEVYNEVVVDEGHHESFIYLAEVNHKEFIIVLEKYNNETGDYQYSLLLYNIYGEMINRFDLLEKPISFHNHHQVLVIEVEDGYRYVSNDLLLNVSLESLLIVEDEYKVQYQGQAYINGALVDQIMINEPGIYEIEVVSGEYEYSQWITVEPKIDIIGEVQREGYIGEIKLCSKGDIFINDIEYISGDLITKPGTYIVNVFGVNDYVKSLKVIIYSKLVYFDGDDQFDLIDGMTFDYPISLYSNSDRIMVNNNIYNGDLIFEIGDYFIELMMDNIVIESFNIKIVSSIDGVSNQETYEEVHLYAFGDVLLNKNKVNGFQLIKEPGVYQISIKNQDGTYEEIEFYIKGLNEDENTSLLPYGILVISLIGLAIILFKK